VVHITMIDGSTVIVPDTAIPTADTTVVSPTTIEVSLDVRDGILGAYDVQVWNPALATDATHTPQKSEVRADSFTILP
jgi:hypothetical protein